MQNHQYKAHMFNVSLIKVTKPASSLLMLTSCGLYKAPTAPCSRTCMLLAATRKHISVDFVLHCEA